VCAFGNLLSLFYNGMLFYLNFLMIRFHFKLSLLTTSFMHNLNSLGACDLRSLLKDVEGFSTRILH